MKIYKKYLKDSTLATNIDSYDKKIGDEGNSRISFLEIIIKNDDFMKTINSLSEKYNLKLTRHGNLVRIEGKTEIINKVGKILIELGVK